MDVKYTYRRKGKYSIIVEKDVVFGPGFKMQATYNLEIIYMKIYENSPVLQQSKNDLGFLKSFFFHRNSSKQSPKFQYLHDWCTFSECKLHMYS